MIWYILISTCKNHVFQILYSWEGVKFSRISKFLFNYRIVQNFDCRNIDRYWLYLTFDGKYLTDGHCLSLCTCKRCNDFKSWWVKFWWSSWEALKYQNFPVKILCYMVYVFMIKFQGYALTYLYYNTHYNVA